MIKSIHYSWKASRPLVARGVSSIRLFPATGFRSLLRRRSRGTSRDNGMRGETRTTMRDRRPDKAAATLDSLRHPQEASSAFYLQRLLFSRQRVGKNYGAGDNKNFPAAAHCPKLSYRRKSYSTAATK